MQKTDRNKTNISYTEKYNTESYQSHHPSYLSIHDRLLSNRQMMDDGMDARQAYEELIRDNIEYEALCSVYEKIAWMKS